MKKRWKLKTDGTDTASDEILLEMLNSAAHAIEVMRPWHWLRRDASLNLIIGQSLYSISGGAGYVLKPKSLRDVRIESLQWHLECTEPDRVYRADAGRTVTGDPTHYWYDGMKESEPSILALRIGFYPIPSAVRTVKYGYTMVLLDVAATGLILMPDAFIPALKDYTSWLWAQHNEKNQNLITLYQTQWQMKIQGLTENEEMPEDRVVVAGGARSLDTGRVPFMSSDYREILSEGEL